MHTFQLIALTPAGTTDPTIAIAATRAGAVGVLDLEFRSHDQAALEAVKRLAQFVRKPFGIRINGDADEFLSQLAKTRKRSALPKHLKVVVITPANSKDLSARIKK